MQRLWAMENEIGAKKPGLSREFPDEMARSHSTESD